jgi:uncharacterized protein (DUF58 family)
VALTTFDREVRDDVAPSSQASHLKQLIQTLEAGQPAGKSSIGQFLERFATKIKRRSVVVLLSDFFDDLGVVLKGLHRLRLARHDVVVLQVLDRDELDFPFDAPTEFLGLEELPDQFADPPAVRQAYRREMEQFERGLSRGCRQHEIDFRAVCTDQPPDQVLVSLLSSH